MFFQKAMRYYRIWIYTCNVTLLISVAIFVATVIWIFSDPKMNFVPGIRLYHPSFIYCYIALFVQGGLLQAVGCIGAMRLQERLLNLYWNILLVLLFGDVIVGIVWLFKFDKISDSLRVDLRAKIQSEYSNDKHLEQLWNRIQKDNKCCGVTGPKDYVNLTSTVTDNGMNEERLVVLPESCCSELSIEAANLSENACLMGHNATFSDGCHDVIHRWLQRRADILFLLGYCVISFLKLCFLGILKYEIREMIQKINVLNGSQDEMTSSTAVSGGNCYKMTSPILQRYAPTHGQSSTSINTVKMSEKLPLHRSSPVINSNVYQQYNHVIPSIGQLRALARAQHTSTAKVALKAFNGNNNDLELLELQQKC